MKKIFSIKVNKNLSYFYKIFILNLFSKINLKSDSDIKCFFNKDYISREISCFGLYEKDELNLIIKFLKKNYIFKNKNCIDVGANIGNHSIFFSNFFKKIYSFEPNQNNFRCLENNTENIKNIEIYNCGLGDRNIKKTIYINPLNMGGSSFVYKTKIKKKAKIVKLDNLINKIKDIFLIKIDVEGYEDKVIRGGLKVIKKFRPIILYESFGKKKVTNLLIKNNYCIFFLDLRSNSSNFLFQRINNIANFFFGKEMKVFYNDNKHPDHFHNLLVAIPKEKQKFKINYD